VGCHAKVDSGLVSVAGCIQILQSHGDS